MNNKDAAPVASGALETIEGYYLKCFNEIDIAHKFKIHKFFFFFFTTYTSLVVAHCSQMLTGIATAGTRMVQKVEPNPVVLNRRFGERSCEHHLLFFSSISPTSLFRSLLYRLSLRLF